MSASFVHQIMNATIQRMVFRYENKELFKIKIYFHYVNFQLYLKTHTNLGSISIVIHPFLRLTIYKPH